MAEKANSLPAFFFQAKYIHVQSFINSFSNVAQR
jgi:hypothetical protein